MKKLTCSVESSHKTEIYIHNGLREHLYELKDQFAKYNAIVIITDKNVAGHYLRLVVQQLKSFGGNVYSIVIPAGEASKNLSQVESIYYKLAEFNLTRSDAIVALGGGVVGDLAGFAAATYMRGIDFFQIPTSLIAMTDSSVGSKTGVDLDVGKNLVGAFYPAQAVFVDPECLTTLEDRYFIDGMAEVIKYGCIASSKLFVRLAGYQYQEDLQADMEDIVAKCLQIKRNIVEEDEKESGVRRILNFGHTIGHVIENYFGYEGYSHGEGVAVGMYNITKMSVREGITSQEDLDNLGKMLIKYGLPIDMPDMDLNRVQDIVMHDKKFTGDILNVCVMPRIGTAEIVRVQKDKAIDLFTPDAVESEMPAPLTDEQA
ncbi:3-dehydroquinate synthase [uncultured Pseudoramibacter sp.]|jgi:3-dehydroquinate synthase|uniref:3-dehydroquinate synthase n=1 Tax=uncultured Pseudoramibacter sp. TaxID=1623493 RepID=UPI0025D79A06|nr:3-dehydroquinate synthase [uncultured Pseudoramibacter sp.]